ncbi:MAG: glycosyltransferase family 4 protein [Acidobacteriia bacterium]|nr:glycosyltransferase family 4 protein [Terriglobia bacterium]
MNPPLSLVEFSIAPVRGGVEEHVLTLLRGLDKSLFRLAYVCPAELIEKLSGDVPPEVEMVPLRLESPLDVAGSWRLATILRRLKADIFHAHMFQASFAGTPTAWACGVPAVIETPHVREQWRTGWIKSHYYIDRLIGRFVDHYIAVSEANARYLVEVKRLPASKISVIPNGCDVSSFDPHRPAPRELKQRLGFDGADPVLVVGARLEPQKGHRVLIKALPLVLEHFPNVKLVCAGDGSLRGELEAMMREHGLEHVIRFVGYQSAMAEWLALADIVVLPSFFEGMPLIALEALAAARPVVATATDGTVEVVIDGETGLTAKPGDPRELATAILRLLRDPALARRLAAAGRARVLARFSMAQQVQSTQALYIRTWQESAQGMAARQRRICTSAGMN